MFGLGFGATFWCIILPALFLLITLLVGISGKCEGKKVEDEYGEENWYHAI